MAPVIGSVLLMVAMGALGAAALRRWAPELVPLELVALGGPLGVVVASLALLPLATIWGFGAGLVMLVGLACAVGAVALWPDRTELRRAAREIAALLGIDLAARNPGIASSVAPRPSMVLFLERTWSWSRILPVLAFAVLVVRSAGFWSGALSYEPDGMWAGHPYIWSDWPLHLANVTNFAYGDNFPPANPHLIGQPFTYHYLNAVAPAAMVELGMDPAGALDLHSFLFSVLYPVAIYAFARRLTRNSGAGLLAVVLFLLGGGFGWVLRLAHLDGTGNLLRGLWDQPWDQAAQEAANFTWPNMFFMLLAPQRAFLYGLPLGLLTFTLLLVGTRTRRWPSFVVAGVVAGLLPLADLGTLLALALTTPFLFVLLPGSLWRPVPGRRWLRLPTPEWVLFFAIWVLVALPQLFLQQGGGSGATSGARIQVGWVAAPDNWLWFWAKSLGFFLPLLGFALADRRLVPPLARRLLWGFMPMFAIGNLVVFQPWDWNNTKFLLWWFLAVCVLVASLVVKIWDAHRVALVRTMLGGVVASMLLTGVLMQLHQLRGNERFQLFGNDELALAEAVRAATPPHAVFAVGLNTNEPVPAFAGRRVVMGYPGWLGSYGIDFGQRMQDLRAIYAFAPETPDLLVRYGVDYVVIGPREIDELAANVEAYRTRYPIAVQSGPYEVFAVGS